MLKLFSSSSLLGGTPRSLSAIDRAGAEVKSRTTLFRKVIVCVSAFMESNLKSKYNLVVPKYPPGNWEIQLLLMALVQACYLALSKLLLLSTSQKSLAQGFGAPGRKILVFFFVCVCVFQ